MHMISFYGILVKLLCECIIWKSPYVETSQLGLWSSDVRIGWHSVKFENTGPCYVKWNWYCQSPFPLHFKISHSYMYDYLIPSPCKESLKNIGKQSSILDWAFVLEISQKRDDLELSISILRFCFLTLKT